MSQVSGVVTYWNLPNFVGELYTADIIPGQNDVNPTFLSLVGGLNAGNARIVPDFNFTMDVDYDFPAASQPDISETDSQTLPDPVSPVWTESDNTAQIYQEAVEITYKKASTLGRRVTADVAGDGSVGYYSETEPNNQQNLLSQLTTYALGNVARKVNYTFLNGAYQKATNAGTSARTRGIITAASTNAIAAGGADLSQELINELMRSMVVNSGGQSFQRTPVLLMNAFQKQKFSSLSIFPPESRNVGGFNLKMIETDFGPVGVMFEPTIDSDTILFASMSVCKPVFVEVPGMGVLFYAPKEKTAASEGGMVYGQIGLDYGPEWMHGKITGLATS